MSRLRALWLVRRDLHRDPGGDTTQIEQTRSALEADGVSTELCSDRDPCLDGFDVVHLFHLDRLWENVQWCRSIRKAGLPAVLSPIWFPTDELDRTGRRGLQGVVARAGGARAYPSLRTMQRAALAAIGDRHPGALRREAMSFERGVRFVLGTVRVLLPNSETEREVLEQRFDAPPSVVVPNGVDVETFASPGGRERWEGVLCVGRLVPRKNQLALIRALRGTGVPLRIVGHHGSLSRGYARRCRREAGAEVELLGPRDRASLRLLYRSARVHASVSWFETPGLASLEAAASGCSLVVTPGGSTREYFGEHAHYCAPDDVASIRSAVERALAAPPSQALAARVRQRFPWSAAARGTRAAYELALGGAADARAGLHLPFAGRSPEPGRASGGA